MLGPFFNSNHNVIIFQKKNQLECTQIFLEITISDLIFVFHYFFLSFFSKQQLVIHDLFIYKERLGKTFAGRALFCSCIVVNRQFWAAYIVYTHQSTSLLHNTHVCEGGRESYQGGNSDGRRHGRGRPAVPDSLAHHFVSWVGRVSLITRLGWRRRVGRRAVDGGRQAGAAGC